MTVIKTTDYVLHIHLTVIGSYLIHLIVTDFHTGYELLWYLHGIMQILIIVQVGKAYLPLNMLLY